MRTTVDLEEDLLRAAKALAREGGVTLSAVVREALRAFLDAQRCRRGEAFELIEAGSPDGRCPSPAEVAASLEEQDDTERLR